MRLIKLLSKLIPIFVIATIVYISYIVYTQEGFSIVCPQGTIKGCASGQREVNNKCFKCPSNKTFSLKSSNIAKCNGVYITPISLQCLPKPA